MNELETILHLAGVKKQDNSYGKSITLTSSDKARIMRENNIRPGTDAWFKLWFSKPYLTGEKPV
jgi:hypothetical protein